jgi:hypothetical protein
MLIYIGIYIFIYIYIYIYIYKHIYTYIIYSGRGFAFAERRGELALVHDVVL